MQQKQGERNEKKVVKERQTSDVNWHDVEVALVLVYSTTSFELMMFSYCAVMVLFYLALEKMYFDDFLLLLMPNYCFCK